MNLSSSSSSDVCLCIMYRRGALFNAGSGMELLCRLMYVRDQAGSLDTRYGLNQRVGQVKLLLEKKNGLR